jgi:hypothetical protein
MSLYDHDVGVVGQNHQLETIRHKPHVNNLFLTSISIITLMFSLALVFEVVIFAVCY